MKMIIRRHEVTNIIKSAAKEGAQFSSYTMVRLNGAVAEIFKDWVEKNFPMRAEKVLSQISWLHKGNLNDSEWGSRMNGSGDLAKSIRGLYTIAVKKYLPKETLPPLDFSKFRKGGNYTLF